MLGVISGLSMLVPFSDPIGFSPDTPVLPSLQKATFDLIWFNLRIVMLVIVRRIRLYSHANSLLISNKLSLQDQRERKKPLTVVRKPINTNPRLKSNRRFNFTI